MHMNILKLTKFISVSRKSAGATMAFMAASVLILLLVGVAFFYIVETYSGDKQLCNSADAGALAGAHQIFAVSLSKNQMNSIPNVPQEFLSLGVKHDGSLDSDPTTALFNEEAYNNCAAYTVSIALSAAADPTQAAITNANNVIAALNQFGADLIAAETNSSSTSYPGTAASNMIGANQASNLPGKLFKGAQTSMANVNFGYYTGPTAASNVSLSSNVASSLDQNWLSQITVTVNGQSYLKGNTAINFSTVTGVSGLGTIALIAMEPSTHLIAGQNFITGLSNITQTVTSGSLTTACLPYNAISVQGTVSGQSSSNNSNGQGNGSGGPIGSGSSSSESLTLISNSAAVTGSPAQTFTLPGTNGGSGGTDSAGVAYIAIVNGGDFQAALNAAGSTASTLQSQGYSNITLTPTTNIAFNGSQTDIFDILDWDYFYVNASLNPSTYRTHVINNILGGYGDWIIVGTNSNTGLYNIFQTQGASGFTAQVTTSPQNFPASDYNNVVDNPNLSSSTASIPFVFMADYLSPTDNLEHVTNATVTQCLTDFGEWIAYNQSAGTAGGTDALGRNPNLDPLQASGGSPALFAKNPNSPVPNTLISATSDFMESMTIADALQILDVCVFHDGQFVFTGSEPQWMDDLIPVIADNYGYDYLPAPLSETRPNGFTAIEYDKAEIVLLHAGAGMSESPLVLPSNPGFIYNPEDVLNNGGIPTVYSGLRYFNPFDTSGNVAHYAWPEPLNCPQFETPGTPLQLLQNINRWKNQQQFNPNDPTYLSLMNNILTVLQQMNSNITMTDLTTALGSTNIDLGQTFYLIYNSSQQANDGLSMVTTLPAGTTYQPSDGTQPQTIYQDFYTITSGNEDLSTTSKSLIDTGAAPTSTVSIDGQNVVTAPYGDSEMNAAPYNVISGIIGLPTFAQDTAAFWPSSGANNNHGELRLYETTGPSFISTCCN